MGAGRHVLGGHAVEGISDCSLHVIPVLRVSRFMASKSFPLICEEDSSQGEGICKYAAEYSLVQCKRLGKEVGTLASALFVL